MGRKSKIKTPDKKEGMFYTNNLGVVAWLKMYNIHHTRIIDDWGGGILFEYEKTQRLKDMLAKLRNSEFMQKYLSCLKEAVFDMKHYKNSKEDDKQ
jgi:hypothetical protein